MTLRRLHHGRPVSVSMTLIRAIFELIARTFNEAGAELARLNRLGLRDDALAGKSRRERARAVADALNRRHAGHRRCC
jgi:hypothetical protein